MMIQQSGYKRSRNIQRMFARISTNYDLMNRLMTLGQDRRWRKRVIDLANLPANGGYILDLGAGTGDLGLEAHHKNTAAIKIAADFTIEMMLVGSERPGTETLRWVAADALTIPFPENSFDAVVSGFLLRNVVNLDHALKEQYRVIKPGGRIVALDTTRPQKSLLQPLIQFYMHKVIPLLGQWISGDRDAYVYLPSTSASFLAAEELMARFLSAGFKEVGFERFNFSTIAIHWGEK